MIDYVHTCVLVHVLTTSCYMVIFLMMFMMVFVHLSILYYTIHNVEHLIIYASFIWVINHALLCLLRVDVHFRMSSLCITYPHFSLIKEGWNVSHAQMYNISMSASYCQSYVYILSYTHEILNSMVVHLKSKLFWTIFIIQFVTFQWVSF